MSVVATDNYVWTHIVDKFYPGWLEFIFIIIKTKA